MVDLGRGVVVCNEFDSGLLNEGLDCSAVLPPRTLPDVAKLGLVVVGLGGEAVLAPGDPPVSERLEPLETPIVGLELRTEAVLVVPCEFGIVPVIRSDDVAV